MVCWKYTCEQKRVAPHGWGERASGDGLLFFNGLWLNTEEMQNGRIEMNTLQAPIQTRDADGRTKKERAVLNPLRTAVVVIDLWDYHWCRTWSGRAGTLAQRILVALRHARQLGMTVIYAPTNFVAAYSGHPQRERIAAIPEHRAPSPYDLSAPPYDTEFRLYRTDIPELPKWPGDMCGAKYGCTPNYGGNAMLPWLEIEPEDLICGDGQELYNFCAEKGVENLIYVGGATNMCLVAKPEGIINMGNHRVELLFGQRLDGGVSCRAGQRRA